jgi:DNA-binding response OmpR family regulator
MYEEFLRHHDVVPRCPSDAPEALTIAPAADVIVTGLLLPGPMDGFEFIRRLRADDRTSRTPILVLTAWTSLADRRRAAEAGCDVFLTKPCLPGVLLAEIQRTLRMTS